MVSSKKKRGSSPSFLGQTESEATSNSRKKLKQDDLIMDPPHSTIASTTITAIQPETMGSDDKAIASANTSNFVLTPESSTIVLSYYMQSLKNDMTLHNAVYDVETIITTSPAEGETKNMPLQFRCTLRLPHNAGIRIAKSTEPPHPSKLKAKHSAAFAACKALRGVGEFDQGYNPTPARPTFKKVGSSATSMSSIASGSHTTPPPTSLKATPSPTRSSFDGPTTPVRHLIASGRDKAPPGSPVDRQKSGATLAYERIKQDQWGKIPSKTSIGKTGSPGLQEYPWLSTPRHWEESPSLEPDHLYGTLLKLEFQAPHQARGSLCRTLCLVTSQPLPVFAGHKKRTLEIERANSQMPEVGAGFSMTPVGKLEGWDDEKLRSAFKFAKRLLRSMVNRPLDGKLEETKYILVPLVPEFDAAANEKKSKAARKRKTSTSFGSSGHSISLGVNEIAWNEVERAAGPLATPYDVDKLSDPQSFRDTIASAPSEFSRRFYVIDARYDLSPRSVIPPASKSLAEIAESGSMHDFVQPPTVTKLDQPIFQVEQLCGAKAGGFVYATTSPKFHNQYLIPEVYQKHCLPASVSRTGTMVPSLLNTLNDWLIASEMNHKIFGGILRPDLALQAIQCPTSKAQGDRCYERLEMLGDNLLKLLATISIYFQFKANGKDRMTRARERIVSNWVLRSNTVDSGVAEYIRFTVIKVKEWLPPNWGYVSVVGNTPNQSVVEQNTQMLGDKVVADIAEALIGAAYVSDPKSPLDNALKAMKALKIQMNGLTSWKDIRSRHSETTTETEQTDTKAEEGWMKAFKPSITIFGYTFKDIEKAKIVLSFTRTAEQEIRYQEHEFLGDALIDHLTMQNLWKNHPECGPGALTNMKHSRVSNAVFSSFAVVSGLLDQVTAVDPITAADYERYKSNIRKAQRDADAALAASSRNKGDSGGEEDENEGLEFWFNVRQTKNLGDLVEASIGAIFDDSGFSMEVVENIFAKTLEPFTNKYCIPPSSKAGHPKAAFLEMMITRPCFGFEIERLPQNTEGKFGTAVFMHDVELARSLGEAPQIATRKACELALRKIKKGTVDIEKVCDCVRKGRKGAVVWHKGEARG